MEKTLTESETKFIEQQQRISVLENQNSKLERKLSSENQSHLKTSSMVSDLEGELRSLRKKYEEQVYDNNMLIKAMEANETTEKETQSNKLLQL